MNNMVFNFADTDGPYEGTRAASVSYTPNTVIGVGELRQQFALQSGKRYNFSTWYKATSAG